MDTNTEDAKHLAQKWVGYRPEIQVVDCTIRDGGLMNNHQFEDATVTAVYRACAAASVDYMEIGYKGDESGYVAGEHGKWRFCKEDDIRRVIDGSPQTVKLSVMADAERTDFRNQIVPKAQSVIDMIRVAAYIHQVPTALDMIKDAKDKGYHVCVNLMSVSVVNEAELDQALEMFARSDVDGIYLVDSFGALFTEQVRYLMRKYLSFAGSAGKVVGIHAHNNQQLAFANTIEAIIAGANMVDGSLAGFGRGAGNCHTELLLGFLRNPKYHMRPLLECIQNHVEPLRDGIGWGPDIPYMLCGQRNLHPRAAIKFNDGPDRGNVLKFYDLITDS
jgi:4-hydroxy 2-oxovalerate aldolase